jgi:mono/diheme cytochrome c family protein
MSKKKKKPQPEQPSRPVERESAPLQPGSSLVVASPSGAAVLDDGPEPTAGEAALPVLLIALLGLLTYVADMHLSNRGGEFNQLVYYPFTSIREVDDSHPQTPEQLLRRKGKQVYDRVCLACHQATGQGAAGQFPPLAGSEWVLGEGPNRIIRIVLDGVQGPITVSGNAFNNAMPPWKDVLKDDEIAAVLTFVRSEWGNKAAAVAVEEVQKIREKEKARGTAWAPDDLKKVPEKD